MTGEDELNTLWPTCKFNKKLRRVLDNRTCNNVFLCKQGSLDYVELDRLCDGKEDCGEENSVCLASQHTPKLFVLLLSLDSISFMLYCLPGLQQLERLADPCIEESFISPDNPLYGLDKLPKLKTPDITVNCGNVFGELYVYLSCLGRCRNSTCLLAPLKHDSCLDDFPDKAFTLAKDGYLTFVVQQRGEYHNRFFLCKNMKCINLEKVCDLANDCGDSSDEAYCKNHFQCRSSKFYISHVKKCDGIVDCMDYSDECNHECGKEIISGVFLKTISWVIGGAAVMMNLYSLWNAFFTCGPWKVNAALINRTFKVLINVGDLMIGLYLLFIVLVDSHFGKSYCQNRLSWLTSDTCSALGVISTMGSTISLFSMTYLSFFRVMRINMQGITSIGQIKSKIFGTVSIITLSSVTIACIPLFSAFDDFYVNGIAYNKNISLFIGAANKKNHLDVIDAYFGKISRRDISWKLIKTLINLMFSDDYGKMNRRKIHFYGNEGVCLFKYFVQRNDPQRIYVWMMLTVNFMSSVVISICYSVISTGAKKTRTKLQVMMPNINNKERDRETRRIQRNITRIIVSDLICWIPFLCICVLHSFELIDATFLYSISSVVILPINSVVNPFIYDGFIVQSLSNLGILIVSKFTQLYNSI